MTPNDSIQKAANIIAHYRIREVPVVQKNKIIGVITAKRILKVLSSRDNKWIKANLIYTQNPVVISSEESLSNARRIMASKKLDHLPVMNQGKIKQVLTSAHILQYIMPQESQGRKSKGSKTIHKYFDVVKILVENGAAIDFKNEDGETPLSFAVMRGYGEIVAFLRKHGKTNTIAAWRSGRFRRRRSC